MHGMRQVPFHKFAKGRKEGYCSGKGIIMDYLIGILIAVFFLSVLKAERR